jgi:hypothetical protein
VLLLGNDATQGRPILFQLRQQMIEVPQRLDLDLRRTHAQRSAGRRVEDPGRAAQHDTGRDLD